MQATRGIKQPVCESAARAPDPSYLWYPVHPAVISTAEPDSGILCMSAKEDPSLPGDTGAQGLRTFFEAPQLLVGGI